MYRGILSVIAVILTFLCLSSTASASEYAVMNGPWFSLDENWNREQFCGFLTTDPRGFPGVYCENLRFSELQTLKTDSGTVQYLEVFNPADDATLAFIGYKNIITGENGDETIMTFYNVHRKNGLYIASGNNRLNAIYRGTVDHKMATFIEFNEIVYDKNTEVSPQKIEFNRLVFAINFDNSVIKSQLLDSKKNNKCNDIKKCETDLNDRLKSLVGSKSFSLSSRIKCRQTGPENDKVSPSFVCTKK